MQRILDLTFSGLAIVMLIPLLIPIILALKFTGEGEILYFQARVGINGKTFNLYKFATMMKNSSNIGTGDITIKNDPRVLPFGKILRKTKINELPQLWNILAGDMSLVGPRPMVPETFANYPEDAQEILNTVKPGLSGIGSIIFRDEEKLLDGRKNAKLFYDENITPHKADLEIWFVNNNSLWLYFKIIFITGWIVAFPQSKISHLGFKGIPNLPDVLKI